MYQETHQCSTIAHSQEIILSVCVCALFKSLYKYSLVCNIHNSHRLVSLYTDYHVHHQFPVRTDVLLVGWSKQHSIQLSWWGACSECC